MSEADIPADIEKTVEGLFSQYNYQYDGPTELEVAHLILAERERCAQIADEIEQPGIPGSGEWLTLGNFAGAIRDAIRKTPSHPEEDGE
jgi:hypothetical protein